MLSAIYNNNDHHVYSLERGKKYKNTILPFLQKPSGSHSLYGIMVCICTLDLTSKYVKCNVRGTKKKKSRRK